MIFYSNWAVITFSVLDSGFESFLRHFVAFRQLSLFSHDSIVYSSGCVAEWLRLTICAQGATYFVLELHNNISGLPGARVTKWMLLKVMIFPACFIHNNCYSGLLLPYTNIPKYFKIKFYYPTLNNAFLAVICCQTVDNKVIFQ